MKWVEVKMKELGVLNNPNYKITALLDHLAMISVQSESRGVFDCKPLGLIWGKYPQVSALFISEHCHFSIQNTFFDLCHVLVSALEAIN